MTGDDGLAEDQWAEKYPDCGGKRQSPIDVQRRKVKFNKFLKPLHMVNYDVEQPELSMTNNGHTGRGTRGAGSLHEKQGVCRHVRRGMHGDPAFWG